jgi:hypothetical protein
MSSWRVPQVQGISWLAKGLLTSQGLCLKCNFSLFCNIFIRKPQGLAFSSWKYKGCSNRASVLDCCTKHISQFLLLCMRFSMLNYLWIDCYFASCGMFVSDCNSVYWCDVFLAAVVYFSLHMGYVRSLQQPQHRAVSTITWWFSYHLWWLQGGLLLAANEHSRGRREYSRQGRPSE